jgi:hypothetical protein
VPAEFFYAMCFHGVLQFIMHAGRNDTMPSLPKCLNAKTPDR